MTTSTPEPTPNPNEFHLDPPDYDKVQEGADVGDLTARDDH